ncbi:unnamed protein product [Tilletia controversa]|nr:unnamed protein product [Tilletia controversa]
MVEAVLEFSENRAKLTMKCDKIAAVEAAKLRGVSETNEKEKWTGDQAIKWAELNAAKREKEGERDERRDERREMEARRAHEANLERARRAEQWAAEKALREEQREEKREEARRREEQWRMEMELRARESERQAKETERQYNERAEERQIERKRLELEAKRIERRQPAQLSPPQAAYGQGAHPYPISPFTHANSFNVPALDVENAMPELQQDARLHRSSTIVTGSCQKMARQVKRNVRENISHHFVHTFSLVVREVFVPGTVLTVPLLLIYQPAISNTQQYVMKHTARQNPAARSLHMLVGKNAKPQTFEAGPPPFQQAERMLYVDAH